LLIDRDDAGNVGRRQQVGNRAAARNFQRRGDLRQGYQHEAALMQPRVRQVHARHVDHFVKTAKAGGYDGTTFHRIIPRGIIQGGDPISKDPKKSALYGTGGLGVLKAEFSDRPMTRGSVAAVLRPSSRDSAGSQFFICLSDQAALTGKFTIFGEVAEGMDVVDKIGETPVEGDRAQARVEIVKVSLK